MIYRPAAGSGRHDALRLWIKVYGNDSNDPMIAPERIYTGNAPKSLHPVLVWRNGNMIYYLTGNATSPMIDAAAALRVAAAG